MPTTEPSASPASSYIVSLGDSRVELLFPAVCYSMFDRTGNWSIWQVLKLGEASRHTSLLNGGLGPIGKLVNEHSGMFLVNSRTSLAHGYQNLSGSTVPHPVRSVLELIEVGNTSFSWQATMTSGLTGALLFTQVSKMVYINRRTRRPQPFPDTFIQKYGHLKKKTTVKKITIPTAPPSGSFCHTALMAYSDTDTNHHVNQATYIRICMDCATRASLAGFYRHFTHDMCYYPLRNLVVNYLGESLPNDELKIYTWQDGTSLYTIHFSVHKEDQQICYATFQFTDNLLQKGQL